MSTHLHEQYRALMLSVLDAWPKPWTHTEEHDAILDEYALSVLSANVGATRKGVRDPGSILGPLDHIPVDLPRLLDRSSRSGALTLAVLQGVLDAVWLAETSPGEDLASHIWLPLFERAGFLRNDQAAVRPRRDKRLYRASIENGDRQGMHWTEDADLAQRWARNTRHTRGDGRVYTARVEPSRLLAHIESWQNYADHWVVDPRGLDVSRIAR